MILCRQAHAKVYTRRLHFPTQCESKKIENKENLVQWQQWHTFQS